MKELAIILAIGSIAWGALWFFFKLWLLGKGLTWLGNSLQLQAHELQEREQGGATLHEDGPRSNQWGTHISEWRGDPDTLLDHQRRPTRGTRNPGLTVIKGGKR